MALDPHGHPRPQPVHWNVKGRKNWFYALARKAETGEGASQGPVTRLALPRTLRLRSRERQTLLFRARTVARDLQNRIAGTERSVC